MAKPAMGANMRKLMMVTVSAAAMLTVAACQKAEAPADANAVAEEVAAPIENAADNLANAAEGVANATDNAAAVVEDAANVTEQGSVDH